MDHFESLSQAGSIQIQDFDLWGFYDEVKSNIRFQVLDYIAKVLLPRCEEQLRERKLSKSELSYDSLLVLFNQASLNHDFAQRLKDRFKVLFIDEFQDTNLLQWRSFSQVFIQQTDKVDKRPTEIILVGDPKQAIYAFRGGDIHTYTEVKTSDVTTRSLDCNFRSDPLLICAMNTLYSDNLGLNTFDYYKSATSALPEITESFLEQIKEYHIKLDTIDVDQSVLEKVQGAAFFKTHLNRFISELPTLILEIKDLYNTLTENDSLLFKEKVQCVFNLASVKTAFKPVTKQSKWLEEHWLYYNKIFSTFDQLKPIITSVKLYCYSLLNTHEALTNGLGETSQFVKKLDYVQVKYPVREGIEKKNSLYSDSKPKLRFFSFDEQALEIDCDYPIRNASGFFKSKWIQTAIGYFIAQEIQNVFKEELLFELEVESSLQSLTELLEVYKEKQKKHYHLNYSKFAILVNANKHARAIKKTLEEWHIASALVLDQSIWAHEVAQDFILLLEALLDLNHEGKVVGALCTPLFGYQYAEASYLAKTSRGVKEKLVKLSNYWLKRKSPMALLSEYLDEKKDLKGNNLVELNLGTLEEEEKTRDIIQLLRKPKGQEYIIHLKHLVALLHKQTIRNGLNPDAQLSYLKKMNALRAYQEERQAQVEYSEEELITYSSEPNAVQILTVHKAKGLEYEVVFCASLWDEKFDGKDDKVIRINGELKDSLIGQDSTSNLTYEPYETHAESPCTRLFVRPSKKDSLVVKNLESAEPKFSTLYQDEIDLEKLRHLYVNYTRAAKRLFLFLPAVDTHNGYSNVAFRHLFDSSEDSKPKSGYDIGQFCKVWVKRLNSISKEVIEQTIDMKASRLKGEEAPFWKAKFVDELLVHSGNIASHTHYTKMPVPTQINKEELLSLDPFGPPEFVSLYGHTWNTHSFSSIFKSKKDPNQNKSAEVSTSVTKSQDSSPVEPKDRSDEGEDHVTDTRAEDDKVKLPPSVDLLQGHAYGRTLADDNTKSLLLRKHLPIGLRANILGNFIHEVFEHWSPHNDSTSSESHQQSLKEVIFHKLKEENHFVGEYSSQHFRHLDEQSLTLLSKEDLNTLEQLTIELWTMTHSPLGGLFDDQCALASFAPQDVMHEMEFNFPILQGKQTQGSIKFGAFKKAFAIGIEEQVELEVDQSMLGIMKAQNEALTGYQDGRELSGLMTGSIDLCFRKEILGHDQVMRSVYFIADYKSNYVTLTSKEEELFDQYMAYHPSHLGYYMIKSNYHLQAHLYLVALHRYLKQRIRDYDYDLHVGGYYYLFVRGMIGESALIPNETKTIQHQFSAQTHLSPALGSVYYKPPKARIEALSKCFTKEGDA